jgi:hypothetical protein
LISRTRIFISAVSSELHTARQLVAQTLQLPRLNYVPDWLDVFGVEHGNVKAMLRRHIDRSHGVIQLVGHRYGAEPHGWDTKFGRVSYTQYEALYARQKGKPVWYLILGEQFPVDSGAPAEPEQQQQFQRAYREKIRAGDHLYHDSIDTHEGLENAVLKLSDELTKADRAAKRMTFAALALLSIIAAAVVWLSVASIFKPPSPNEFPKSAVAATTAGYWARDQYVGVRVAQPVSGTLLGPEPYEIKLDLRNASSMYTSVTKIIVVSRNREAKERLGFGDADARVFTTQIHVPYHLPGSDTVTVPVRLNQILPKDIWVEVYHNQASAPSKFHIDLVGTVLAAAPTRRLSQRNVAVGYDSHVALKLATQSALRWSPDAQLIAQFPGDHTKNIDGESRLIYFVVESWVATFYSAARRDSFVAIVSPSGVREQTTAGSKDRESVLPRDTPQPAVSYQHALELANRAGVLSSDWNDPRLGRGKFGTKVIYAWFLPYKAPDGFPVIIDAATAERFILNADQTVRRERLR